MAEYTYADVIIDPNDPRVEIGKEYYFSDTPKGVLDYANRSSKGDYLEFVAKSEMHPFSLEKQPFHKCCLIRKKEPEKRYVPFDFDDPEVRKELMGKTIVNNHDLDGEGEFREVMIVGFLNKSDEDRDCWSSNGDTEGTVALTIDGYFHADELMKECTFLDGTPCGRLVEEE